MAQPNARGQNEAGARDLFLATNDRYAAQRRLVPVLNGLEVLTKSSGGVYLVDPDGEAVDNERLLAVYRK